MINYADKYNHGVVLIVSLIVVTSLVLLGGLYLVMAVTERGMAGKDYFQKQAFWLAEAGLDRARNENAGNWINNSIGPFNDETGIGQYEVNRTINPADTSLITYESWGYVPSKVNAKYQKRIEETIKIEQFNLADQVISSQGSLDVSGNAEIHGDVLSAGSISVGCSAQIIGASVENFSFIATYEDVFSMTREDMLAIPPDYSYTNPSNNAAVSGLTWVTLSESGTFRITQNGWEGSGILVVEGGNLEITGGTFNGIIWIDGALRVSGNGTINGCIIVDSPAEVDTIITGTPLINYSLPEIENALGSIGSFFSSSTIDNYELISWQDF